MTGWVNILKHLIKQNQNSIKENVKFSDSENKKELMWLSKFGKYEVQKKFNEIDNKWQFLSYG